MDYTEQRKFLRSSRIWGAALVLLLFAAVAACIKAGKVSDSKLLALYAAVTLALAIFIYYTPDYLHLSVDPAKRSRWAVKIRWRIIAAVLVLSALLASNTHARVWAAAAIVWLVALNLFGRKVPRRFVPLYFWLGETALLAALLLMVRLDIVRLDLLLATLLLAAAAHLAITVADRASLYWIGVVCGVGLLLVVAAAWRQHVDTTFAAALAVLLLVASLATALLVHRADVRNAENVNASVHELNAFTGYSVDRILHLWAVS
ncbi:MAG TPA: hypothetical protein VGR76_07555, partial [Candidatus Angelobacter sp.]|nr:hypothetical protein [Candidatus Angelobacter sp.]